jgi:FtsZ-binding cell division protein ZapB
MSDDDDSNVRRPFEVSVRRGKFCRHRQTEVCGEERVVTCKVCGAVLDPIDVLLRMAQSRERLVFEKRYLSNEVNELKVARDELKREVRNLKGSIRRRTPKPEPAAPENVVPLHRGKGIR